MPINVGIGRMNLLVMPKGGQVGRASRTGLSPGGQVGRANGTIRVSKWTSLPFRPNASRITGITKDSTGAALGGCTVDLFTTVDDRQVGTTTSDGSGNYTLECSLAGPFYLVAYKPGAPDVSGTTLNTVVSA